MQRILLAQIVIAASIAIFFLSRSGEEAVAALFGGGVALINGVLIARRIRKNATMSQPTPTTEVRSMYVAVIERFISIAVFLAVGFMIWQDERAAQFALIVGFIGGQIAFMIFGKTNSA